MVFKQIVQLPENLGQVSSIDFVDQKNERFVGPQCSLRGKAFYWTWLEAECAGTGWTISFNKIFVGIGWVELNQLDPLSVACDSYRKFARDKRLSCPGWTLEDDLTTVKKEVASILQQEVDLLA